MALRGGGGQSIASAILDLSRDPQEDHTAAASAVEGASSSTSHQPTSHGFESRGVSLPMLELMADTARTWRSRRRVVLRDTGDTAIVLREDGDDFLWVQVRRVTGATRDARTIERDYRRMRTAEVGRTLRACVGERVSVLPAPPSAVVGGGGGGGNELTNTFDGDDGSATPCPWPGTIISYDADAHMYMVEPYSGADASTSNYSLKWAAADVVSEAVEGERLVADASFTTKDACEELVQPLTRRSGRSLVDCLSAVDAGRASENEIPALVGPAQIFASHAWKYEFSDAVDALLLWNESKGPECFVWFDIATVPQHPHKQLSLPPDYFYNEFREGIRHIGHTVLIMIPMRDPLPLTRAWCVWEIVCSLQTGARFETALTPADQTYRDTHSVLIQIEPDVSQAKSWLTSDTDRILEACGQSGGCEAIDAMVRQKHYLC